MLQKVTLATLSKCWVLKQVELSSKVLCLCSAQDQSSKHIISQCLKIFTSYSSHCEGARYRNIFTTPFFCLLDYFIFGVWLLCILENCTNSLKKLQIPSLK